MSGIPEPTKREIPDTRAYRRANALGMKKIIKKIRKGMSAEMISKKTGVPIENIVYLQGILKMQVQRTAEYNEPVETELLIDGKEVE